MTIQIFCSQTSSVDRAAREPNGTTNLSSESSNCANSASRSCCSCQKQNRSVPHCHQCGGQRCVELQEIDGCQRESNRCHWIGRCSTTSSLDRSAPVPSSPSAFWSGSRATPSPWSASRALWRTAHTVLGLGGQPKFAVVIGATKQTCYPSPPMFANVCTRGGVRACVSNWVGGVGARECGWGGGVSVYVCAHTCVGKRIATSTLF